MMRSVFFLVMLCVSCALALDFSFKAGVNVTASVTDNGWQYRKVQMAAWNYGLWEGANYKSVAVTRSPGQATLDVVTGACVIGTGIHPMAYIAYFNAEADWTLNVTDNIAFANATITSAAGYVGAAYLRLVETDPQGRIVASWNLKGAVVPSAATGVSWSVVDHSSASANLKYVTLNGDTGISATWSVSLSFIASSVAGILNQSDTIVGPKSFESVLQIQNWPYQSSSNSLNLLIGVGTGAATISSTGHSIISTNNTNKVYFTAVSKVSVGSNIVDATVDIAVNGTADIPDPQFYEQLTSKYGGTASYHIVTVKFPAGAANIVYDPAVGAGQPMEGADGSGGSSTTTSFAVRTEAVSLFVLFATLLAFFL